jgi:hypothetical protein
VLSPWIGGIIGSLYGSCYLGEWTAYLGNITGYLGNINGNLGKITCYLSGEKKTPLQLEYIRGNMSDLGVYLGAQKKTHIIDQKQLLQIFGWGG